MCIYLCVYVCLHTCINACMPCMPRHTCGNQRTALRSWVSPSTMWSWGLDSCQAKSAKQPLNSYFWGFGVQIRQPRLFDFWGGLEMAEHHGSSTSQSQWLHLKEKRERPKSHNPNSEQDPQWPKKLPLGLILKSPKTNHYFNYSNKHKWLCLFNSIDATFLESAVMFIFNFFLVLVSPARLLYNFFHVYIYHHLNKNLPEPH